MSDFLMLRLRGVMQAWGGHTYEDYRPSHNFPTRSGIEGLLAACLGLEREDHAAQSTLAESFVFAVRADEILAPGMEQPLTMRKTTDFHTVMEARKVDGKANKNPVISRREYLCDRQFTMALQFKADAAFSLEQVAEAVRRPYYTPFLGRRSCVLSAPLFLAVHSAADLRGALDATEPGRGVIYSADLPSDNRIDIRDRRDFSAKRRFAKRTLYIHGEDV